MVYGYVVMPEHFHLLMTEPELGDPSVVMKVIKERFSRKLRVAGAATEPVPLWQKRFHDFNVWTEEKQVEKLRYIHRNPVKRGLVEKPELWKWSSFRFYLFQEPGLVRVNVQEWPIEIKTRPATTFGGVTGANFPLTRSPLIRKERE